MTRPAPSVDPGLLSLPLSAALPPGTTTEVYLLAVRHPGITERELAEFGFEADTVSAATAELQGLGLLRSTGAAQWEALPPDITLTALAGQLETRAATTRAISAELARVYRNARQSSAEGGEGIVVLNNLQELYDASEHVVSSAEQEVVCFREDSPLTAHLFGRDPASHRGRWTNSQGRPLRMRATYDASVLDLPRATDILTERRRSGEDCRFARGLAFSVVVADTTAAIVDLTSYDSSGQGCLLVHDRRFVLALSGLAESVWRLATPMVDDGALNRQTHLILSLLAAGATDATIAARVGISQRTVERKVRSLMEQLGAVTRFQAGVQAVQRGWL